MHTAPHELRLALDFFGIFASSLPAGRQGKKYEAPQDANHL